MKKPKNAGRQRPAAAYHHGDLRAALLAAAEAELAERGIEGLTLRGCARRAGVSHAAPAHHFKDVETLLTELGAIGFERLAAYTERHAREAAPATLDRLVAIARGYVTFAVENPAYYRLIFRIDSVDCDSPRYAAAGAAAFAVPVRAVGECFGSDDPMADPALVPLVIGLWSIAHGFADLAVTRQLEKGGPAGTTAASLIDRLLPTIVRQFFASPPPRATAP